MVKIIHLNYFHLFLLLCLNYTLSIWTSFLRMERGQKKSEINFGYSELSLTLTSKRIRY